MTAPVDLIEGAKMIGELRAEVRLMPLKLRPIGEKIMELADVLMDASQESNRLSADLARVTAERDAAEAKLARLVDATVALGKWCVENILPDETLDHLLNAAHAALADIKGDGE